MRATGRPKTSIYFHIQSIPLSSEKKRNISFARSESAKALSLARKGKSVRTFRTFDEWTPELVLLLAHLSFDGEIGRTRCVYNNRNERLIQRVEKLMKALYDFEPKRYINRKTGVMRTTYNNVALGAYLRIKAEELFETIGALPIDEKREFLRAFFDDEGCMDFRPQTNKRAIRGYQKDARILHIVVDVLAAFSIQAEVKYPNEVVISGKQNLLKFKNEINFSSSVRINGNRSNSTWKEHLEKRDILDRAIASFRS